MWHRLSLYLAFAWAIQCASPVRAASPEDDAVVATFNERVDLAIWLREHGELVPALEAFDDALRAIRDRSGPVFDKGRSLVRYHQGQLLVALERYAEARAMLTLLLDSPGLEPAERERVAGRLAEVEAQLAAERAAAQPARLTVHATGVETGLPVDVRVAGVAVGRAPVVVERPAGRYLVELGAIGYLPGRAEVELAAGAEVERVVRLEPIAGDGDGLAIAGWASVGAGAAMLVGAAALHVDAANELDLATVEGTPYGTAMLHRNTGRDESNAAYILYSVGGAALVAGLALLLFDADAGPDPADRGAGRWLIGPGGGGFAGRF